MKPDQYPHCCPMCKSDDIDEFDIEHDDEFRFGDWSCGECAFQWRVEFEFVKWEPL